MSGAQQAQFLARVQQLAQGSPYVATPTERGFDIHVEIADAHWRTLLSEQSIEKTYTFQVVCDEAAHTYAVTDVARNVQRGTLSASISKEWSSGSTRLKEFGRVYAWDDSRGPSEVVNYYFDADEGHALIERAATELGWGPRARDRCQGRTRVCAHRRIDRGRRRGAGHRARRPAVTEHSGRRAAAFRRSVGRVGDVAVTGRAGPRADAVRGHRNGPAAFVFRPVMMTT